MSELRPLIVTDDSELLDDLLRLAAAAGVQVEVAPDHVAALGHWHSAPLVVLDAGLGPAPRHSGAPAGSRVVLVERGSPGAARRAPDLALGGDLRLELPKDDAVLVDLLGACQERQAPPGLVLGVLAGSGGAGASIVATALALSAARNGDAFLIDLDPFGGGLDLLLGTETEPGLRWPDLAGASGRLSPLALREALPSVNGVAVLSCERGPADVLSAGAVRAVLLAGRRAGGVTVADLPRHLSEPVLAALSTTDEVVLVVRAGLRQVAAATVVCADLAAAGVRPRLVVRRTSIDGLSSADVAGTLGVPFAGEFRDEQGIRSDLERGRPLALHGRHGLRDLAACLLDQLTAERLRREAA